VSYQVITTGYAVLALIADAMVLLVLIGFVASRRSPALRERWDGFRDGLTPFALHAAWIVSVLAMLGSLYLSQIAGLVPCEFCWFQRICMYPLTLLLGIAAFRGEIAIAKRYLLTMSLVGVGLAVYQYQLERIPQPTVCSVTIPCNEAAFNIFGFISIPYLSMAAFLLITTLLLLARSDGDETELAIDDPTVTEPIDAVVSSPV
jgi:disulfide bond formation protein DsbB